HENKLKREPGRAFWLAGLQEALVESAAQFSGSDAQEAALNTLERARKVLDDLRQQEPREARWLVRLADLHGKMATSWWLREAPAGQQSRHEEYLRRSLDCRRQEAQAREAVLAAEPARADQAEALAAALRQQAHLHSFLNEVQQAEQTYLRHLEALH